MAPTKGHKEMKKRIKKMYNGEYELLSEFIGTGHPITLRHIPCGNVYKRNRANTFINEGEGLCPICNRENKKRVKNYKNISEKEFAELIKEEDSDYEYISGFKNHSKKKVILRHIVCNNEYEVEPTRFFSKRKRRCKFCSNSKRGEKMDNNYLTSILEKTPRKNGNEFLWLEEYKGDNKKRHLIKHKNCGHEFEIMPNTVQYYGIDCPICKPSGFSNEEKELLEFIKENYNDEIKENYRINNKELDIYIPDLKIGFEYNGFYWHSDKFKDKNYHLNKLNYFQEKGINVYFIDSTDWINKNDIIKSKIKNILKNTCNKKYARKLYFSDNVDLKDEKDFLNKNHIQGYAISSYKFSLRDENGKIYAILTYVKPRKNVNNKNENNEIELLRYSTLLDYNVVGGFSKLLKNSEKFLKDLGYDTIKSYAYKDMSRGNLYLKNNFYLYNESKPSYNYVYKGIKYNRFKFRKSELKKNFSSFYNESKTEIEIADEIPSLYRIWNCGNYIFKKEI